MVYIADLRPGEYYVSLNRVSGYKVPENPTKVRVKDKVEYVASAQSLLSKNVVLRYPDLNKLLRPKS